MYFNLEKKKKKTTAVILFYDICLLFYIVFIMRINPDKFRLNISKYD